MGSKEEEESKKNRRKQHGVLAGLLDRVFTADRLQSFLFCVVNQLFQMLTLSATMTQVVKNYIHRVKLVEPTFQDSALSHELMYFIWILLFTSLLTLFLWSIVEFIASFCCFHLKRLSHFSITAFLLVPIESTLVVLSSMESFLLMDMAIHLIEMDLLHSYGASQTINRQFTLGGQVPKFLIPWVGPIVVVLILVEIGLYFGIHRLLACARARTLLHWRRLLGKYYLVGAIFLPAILFQLDYIFLETGSHVFRNNIPFNLFAQPSFGSDFIPIEVNPSAYPWRSTLNLEDDLKTIKKPLGLTKKKNIIFITTESMRADDKASADYSTCFYPVVKRHDLSCIKPKRTYSGATVTEISMFTWLYSLNGFNYNSMMKGYRRSNPLFLLRKEGYQVFYGCASCPWSWPNGNLLEANFDDVVYDRNYFSPQAIPKLDEMLEKRDISKPAFLHFHVHGYHLDAPKYRKQTFEVLERHGLLKDSIIAIGNDHGNSEYRDGHGEQGHGHSEASYWNPLILSPFEICFPKSLNPSSNQKYLSPAFASHLDVLPTVLGLLSVKQQYSSSYTDGMNFLFTSSEKDPTLKRVLYYNHRFFPQKDKIASFVDMTFGLKCWFRILPWKTGTRGVASGLPPEDMKEIGFKFLPMKLTDLEDKEICSTIILRQAFNNIRTTKIYKKVWPGVKEKQGRCFHKRIKEILSRYDSELVFWKWAQRIGSNDKNLRS